MFKGDKRQFIAVFASRVIYVIFQEILSPLSSLFIPNRFLE